MYHPQVVAARRLQLERSLPSLIPKGLREYSISEVQEFQQERLLGLFDKKGNQIRDYTAEEDAFICNERLLGKIDFTYFAERYITINVSAQTLGSLYPLWESQRLILEEIGRIELEHFNSDHPDGICCDVLKARQLGASTLAVGCIFHRIITHSQVLALLASDVPDSSDFLWDMFERMYDQLPFYIRPSYTERVKNDEFVFGTGSRLFWGASKSTRGADKSKKNAPDGQKGQLGRGKTFSSVLQSEVATWTNPSQIDTSLEPAIAISPFTFWVKESTAQGRGKKNWWYNEWQLAKAGKARAHPIFIPVFAEREKYTLPAPASWIPSDDTLAAARRYEENGPRWMHRPCRATRNQLYWYERTKYEKSEKNLLAEFLQEYPMDDEEAFQYTGQTQIMTAQMMDRMRNQARPIGSLIEIRSQRELTQAQMQPSPEAPQV